MIASNVTTATVQVPDAPQQDRHAAIVDAAKKFEKIFAGMMVKGMRESGKIAGSEGLFGDGPGSDTYTDWFDGLMSERLASNGGLGMQAKLIREWERGAAPATTNPGKSAEVNHVVA